MGHKTYPSARSGSTLYVGGLRLMSDRRCFFGRQRLDFFAALNCACLAASMVVLNGAATAGATRLVHTIGAPHTDADAPSVRVSAAL